MSDDRFYVYVVRIGGRTRYVGKGTGARASVHLTRSHNKTLAAEVTAAFAIGWPVRSRIVASGLSERDAFRLERRMIWKWRERIVNVSMGSFTPLEHSAMQARADLLTLKSEERVRAEGSYMGATAEERIAHLRDIRAHLERMAEAA
jgi:hypothetical protein